MSADPGELVLSATGIDAQSHVSLMSLAGNFTDLLTMASENQTSELTDELLPNSKITHISTAKAVLFNQYLTENDNGDFDSFTAQIDFEKVIGLASFIKLLADNEDYPLAEGVNTLSFFTDSDDDVLGSIREYLDELGLVEDDGSFSEEYIEAINNARTETLDDETLKLSYTSADVAGRDFAVYGGGNFQASKGTKVLSFNTNGSGISTSSDQSANNIADNFTWSIEDGKIKLAFADATGFTSYPLLSCLLYTSPSPRD